MALAINVSSSSSPISTSSFPSSDLKAPQIGSLRLSDRINVSLASLSLSSGKRSSVKALNVQSITKEAMVPSEVTTEKVDVVEVEDFEELAKKLETASPLEIMDKALEKFGNDIAIAFSGAEDVALIEYAHLTGRPYRVFSLDTGRLNPETYRLFDTVEKHYGIRIEYMFPDAVEVQALVRNKGLFSFYEDGHQECCRIRKVRPLRRALKGLRAWITGQRKDQSPGTRSEIPVVQVDPVFEGLEGGAGSLVKWNPVANVEGNDVWSFLRTMDVPVNTLHAAGYVSTASMESVGRFDGTEDGLEVTLLEVHHVGRVRYILATDLTGKLTVFTENRTVHGSVTPTSRPLVFLKQRLLFLTETGAGSLDLRSMKIRESDCEGLNSSLARTYVFDASERSKAYGFTSEGEVIHVLLLGDVTNFKCRVRSKKKITQIQEQEPVALQAIKGYLVLVGEERVFVYNVTTQHYVRTTGPRLLFPAALEDLRSTFLRRQSKTKFINKVAPLIASDREKLLVMSLGEGYVATYKSKLRSSKGEVNTMLWSSPVFFFILFLFGAWHFFAKKKESLTAWGPDDSFTSSSSATTERAFSEPSSRRNNDDLMDIRRRYVSPSRYRPGGAAAGTYRSVASNEPTSRATVDGTNYRATGQEMKYRGGSGLDSSGALGFGNRRESLFGNNNKALDNES